MLIEGAIAAWMTLAGPCSSPGMTDIYDGDFRASAFIYFDPALRIEWCSLKALAQQESRLRADAQSHAGARGLIQIMPATGRDYGVNPSELFDAKVNIQVAARHVNTLWNFWLSARPLWSRLQLIWASYNAGQGNMFKAQKLCGLPRDWGDIKVCLPDVTGRHSAETLAYVPGVQKWLDKLREGA